MKNERPPVCPVCNEVLSERAARCFHCETKLEAWWPLEERLLEADSQEKRSAWAAGRWAVGLAALVVGTGLGLGWQWLGPEETSVEASLPPVVASSAVVQETATKEPPPVIHYRVQRGDSLWRVALALTGRGADWSSLWPEYAGRELELEVGTVLEIQAAALADRHFQ